VNGETEDSERREVGTNSEDACSACAQRRLGYGEGLRWPHKDDKRVQESIQPTEVMRPHVSQEGADGTRCYEDEQRGHPLLARRGVHFTGGRDM
jgi:hypothetical protein